MLSISGRGYQPGVQDAANIRQTDRSALYWHLGPFFHEIGHNTGGNGLSILRMLLALTVLNYHYQFCPFNFLNSFSAVYTFMMISGFYISMVINERYGSDLQGTFAFYGNRLLRLFPAYWGVLAACRLFWPNQPVAFSDIFLIPQPFPYQFGLSENGLYLGQMFTVALELMFYAIAPFIVLRRLRWLILAFAATAIYTAGAWLAIDKAGLDLQGNVARSWEYEFFPGTLLYFFAGALAYRFYLLVANWRWSRLVGLLALPLLVAVGWLTPSAHRYVWTNNFTVLAGGARQTRTPAAGTMVAAG